MPVFFLIDLKFNCDMRTRSRLLGIRDLLDASDAVRRFWKAGTTTSLRVKPMLTGHDAAINIRIVGWASGLSSGSPRGADDLCASERISLSGYRNFLVAVKL